MHILVLLKFTPLEFETVSQAPRGGENGKLKFTPLEFETKYDRRGIKRGV